MDFTGGGLVKPLLIGCSLAAILVAVGCGNGPQRSEPPVTDGTEEAQAFWEIGLTGALSGDAGPCAADPVVAGSWQSADMPSSHLGLALVPEASEADAERIAECLRAAFPDSEMTIRRTEGTADLSEGPGVTGAHPVGPDPSAGTAPGSGNSCAAQTSPGPVQPGDETTGSASCADELSAPLTREEMINATPMPIPVVPRPSASMDGATSGTLADPHSSDQTAGRVQRVQPAPWPENR
jgi:hypothetical protein